MNKRVASALLVAPTIVLSYLIVLIGHELPSWEYIFFRAKSLDDIWVILPSITRFAVLHVWIFPTAMAIVCIGSVTLLWRVLHDTSRVLVTGLCLQGVIAWSAMFCFCYNYFTGPMCLHHGPEFEVGTFMTFGLGAFPLTFAAIVTPLLLALFSRQSITS